MQPEGIQTSACVFQWNISRDSLKHRGTGARACGAHGRKRARGPTQTQDSHSQRFQAGGQGVREWPSRRWVLSQGLRPGGSGSQLGWGILRRVALGVRASLEGGVLVRDSPVLHQGSLRGHQARYEDICGGYDGGAPGLKWMGANMHWPQACITEPHPEPSRPVWLQG